MHVQDLISNYLALRINKTQTNTEKDDAIKFVLTLAKSNILTLLLTFSANSFVSEITLSKCFAFSVSTSRLGLTIVAYGN